MADETDSSDRQARTPGRGHDPRIRPIEASAPEGFGLTQVWWGSGKGKTTAAMGMGFRAAGHGYRVHMLQFLKGGADSVEDVRGEYNAISAMPGFTYEHSGQYGWHGLADGSDDADHAASAQAGLDRVRELIDATSEFALGNPLDLDGAPEAGMHMLILDEILYATDRELIAPDELRELIETKPASLELVLTGSHDPPDYLGDRVDLVSEVRKHRHPIDAGQRARKGTEY